MPVRLAAALVFYTAAVSLIVVVAPAAGEAEEAPPFVRTTSRVAFAAETVTCKRSDPDEAEIPEAWAATRTDLQDPAEAMQKYVAWLKGLRGKPVFVGYPASFDFLFVYWYLIRFTGGSPFSFSALDIKSYVMALLKTDYRQSVKRNMPKRWFDAIRHRHVALDDALEQGALFCNMLAENLGRKEPV